MLAPLLPLALAASVPPVLAGPILQGQSVHRAQQLELADELGLRTDDSRDSLRLAEAGRLFPARDGRLERSLPPMGEEEFVVFGYLQSESQVFHTRWHALTHVGSRFVGFDAAGQLTSTASFTGRSSYLKAGGAADAAGVRMILVVASFDDSPGGVIESVVLDPGKRAVLAGEIASLLAADGYAHGVSLDLEFSWGPAVRDGVTALMADLRGALDAVDPALELSIYVNAIHSPSQWDFDPVTGITPHVDHVLYSMYDWATGTRAHAISDFDSCLGPTRLHGYLDDGLPPEKLVPVISAYSRQWANTNVYDGIGTSSSSLGFTDGLFDVTLNPNFGGPYPGNHVTGDEAGWYTWNDGIDRTRTWESPEALEVEIRHVLSLRDPSGAWNGRRLGGVGFWSLFWMAETSSFDPRTGRRCRGPAPIRTSISCAPRSSLRPARGASAGGVRGARLPLAGPERVPGHDGGLRRGLRARPGGLPTRSRGPGGNGERDAGGLRLRGDGGQHPLPGARGPREQPRALRGGHQRGRGRVRRHDRDPNPCPVPIACPGYALRLVVVDADGELEASPPHALDTTGWREVVWDLTTQASAVSTAEPAFADGDGVLDTAGSGARDLGFVGFRIEGTGPAAGLVVLDELAYEAVLPGGKAYTLNELRYAGMAGELVEVHGPAGPLPPGLELRFYDGATGSVLAAHALGGAIADDGGGFGFLVVGDPEVARVDLSSGFDAATDDVPDSDPGGIQLVDTGTGTVLDSLVYEAFGGLDELVRPATLGVTGEGRPWLGECAGGKDARGRGYVLGRQPDGADTGCNAADFGFQAATPGRPNRSSIRLGTTLDFERVPRDAFQTFQTFGTADPVSAGVPPSEDGGRAYRCVDTNGGGVIGVFGDASLGRGTGWRVEGSSTFRPRPIHRRRSRSGSAPPRARASSRRPTRIAPPTRTATG